MRALPLLALLLVPSVLPGQPPPERPRRERPPERRGERPPEGRRGGGYSLEQACSDRAQLNTIAFSGLAFLTGDAGSASFIPPGKVADFFGFQYLRDIDATGKGHNPMFLDRIAGAVMQLLTPEQRRAFETEAREEARALEALARQRLPLVAAFHAERDAKRGGGLERTAVQAATARLFEDDALLALRRAKAFGALAAGLDAAQKATLGRLTFGDFRTWPEVDREALRDLRPRGASKLESVAYMTLASEFFSWIAGSVEADTYFCPERHGTYFGGFYLKDLPAMGKRDFDISTALTGDAGEAFLDALTPGQRQLMDQVLEAQRPALKELVAVRRSIARKLRGCLAGTPPTEAEIRALGRRYGELDGELAWRYARAFSDIGRTLTPAQRAKLATLRSQPVDESGHAFLYSDRIPMPRWPDPTPFFAKERSR